MVRDAMFATAGELDGRLGGPSFQDYVLTPAKGTGSVHYLATDPGTPGFNRRTLYRAWTRGGRNAFLDSLDCPDPSTTAPRRNVTNTPLQALSLMNNALVLHLANRFAARLEREAEQRRLEAERARAPAQIEQKAEVAQQASQAASGQAGAVAGAEIEAEQAMDRAQEARVATFAKPADIVRTRGVTADGGGVTSPST